MSKTKTLLITLCIIAITATRVSAQKPIFNIDLSSELQTNFKDQSFNFANWLQLYGDILLSSKVSAELSTVSAGITSSQPLIDDIIGYSNITCADNVTLALVKASLKWEINEKHTLAAGIRHFDGDYFNSDINTFFTNSAGAGYPTIGCNHNIGITPLSSIGIHYEFCDSLWGAKASIYNGEGYRNFSGHDNIFRFCPNSDGLMITAQGEYKPTGNHYYLGVATHTKKGKRGTEFWAYGEQKICNNVSVITGYSHSFSNNDYCHDFACVGAIVTTGKAQTGLHTDFAHTSDGNEWDIELTCKVTLNDHLYLQPALHAINNLNEWHTVGMMRFGLSY